MVINRHVPLSLQKYFSWLLLPVFLIVESFLLIRRYFAFSKHLTNQTSFVGNNFSVPHCDNNKQDGTVVQLVVVDSYVSLLWDKVTVYNVKTVTWIT